MDPDSENENRIQRTEAGFRERRHNQRIVSGLRAGAGLEQGGRIRELTGSNQRTGGPNRVGWVGWVGRVGQV